MVHLSFVDIQIHIYTLHYLINDNGNGLRSSPPIPAPIIGKLTFFNWIDFTVSVKLFPKMTLKTVSHLYQYEVGCKDWLYGLVLNVLQKNYLVDYGLWRMPSCIQVNFCVSIIHFWVTLGNSCCNTCTHEVHTA